jgi:hypothetical protein
VSQSGYIAGGLLLAFVLYLAAKGRLGVYAAVLWGNTAQPVPSGQSNLATPTSPATQGASVAGTAAKTGLGLLSGEGITSALGDLGTAALGFFGL